MKVIYLDVNKEHTLLFQNQLSSCQLILLNLAKFSSYRQKNTDFSKIWGIQILDRESFLPTNFWKPWKVPDWTDLIIKFHIIKYFIYAV